MTENFKILLIPIKIGNKLRECWISAFDQKPIFRKSTFETCRYFRHWEKSNHITIGLWWI